MPKSYIQTRQKHSTDPDNSSGGVIHEISIMVPPKAQAALGKKTIRRRLEATDINQARVEAAPLIAQYLREIDLALGTVPMRISVDIDLNAADRDSLVMRMRDLLLEFNPQFSGEIKIANRRT